MLNDVLTQLRTLVDECVDTSAWSLPDDSLVDCLDAMHAVEQAVAAVKLHLVREIDARCLPATQHAPTSAVWLREHLRVSIHAAKRLVELSRVLDQRPELDAALGAGLINVEQAQVIAATINDLPTEAGPAATDKAASMLIDFAGEHEPMVLRKLGSRILAHVAPEIAERAEAAALAREESRAHAGRAFTLTPMGDGRVRVTGWLDREAAALVNAALDPLCNPRRATEQTPRPLSDQRDPAQRQPNERGLKQRHPDEHGPTNPGPDEHGLTNPGPDEHGLTNPGPTNPGRDERNAAQRRADALVEVCRLAMYAGQLPDNGGDRPQLVVTLPFEALSQQFGAGMLDTGEPLSPQQVRRLACDAQVIPAVLGGDGQVLELGRARRLFTGPLRRALVLRDGGCAFPGCDRPPRWCDGHHIRPWSEGGPTSLDNAVLLCGHHHRVIHRGEWSVHLAHDRSPEFVPPRYVDRHRRPRRNPYHRRT